MTITKRKPMRKYEIEAFVTRYTTVVIEATDPAHASELFEHGEWDEELPGFETTNWKAVSRPREIR